VRIGVAVGPPFMFRDASGNWTSFSADLARKFGEATGLKVEFVPSSFATFIAGLQADKYDFIQPINATPERSAVVDFADPVSAAGTLYFIKSNSQYKDIKDLNKSSVRIATITGSAEEGVTRKMLPSATLRSLPNATVADLATEVVSGRAEAFVDSSYLAPAVESQFDLRTIPTYESTPDGLEPVNISFAVRKGEGTLLKMLNDFIAQEKSSGDLKALQTKWFTVENSLKG
jgi:ABC-type amino acid transport substrate-binding protein